VRRRFKELSIHDAEEINAPELARCEDCRAWVRAVSGDLMAVDRATAIFDRIDGLGGYRRSAAVSLSASPTKTLGQLTAGMEDEADKIERLEPLGSAPPWRSQVAVAKTPDGAC
jgi:hypothetical protein